ncbi:MAG: calcium-binding protein [Pseudomonadota bacterium]
MRAWLIAAAVLATVPVPALAQIGPMGGGGEGRLGGNRPGGPGGPGGRQGRPALPQVKPVKRAAYDKAVEAMFRLADTDRDGIVAPAELRKILDARRDAIIRKRFASIDANHDKLIDEAEFLAWQRGLGDDALEEDQGDPDLDLPNANVIRPPVKGDDIDDRVLRALIEPISAMTLVQANSNYDAGVSLDELLAYEGKRFEAADANKDGTLAPDEMRALMRGRRGDRSGAEGSGGPGVPGGPGGPPPQGGRPPSD